MSPLHRSVAQQLRKTFSVFLILTSCFSPITTLAEDNRNNSKKGACLTTKHKSIATWKAKVSSLNVSWHYSWDSKLNSPEPTGVEFVPMIWGFWGASDRFKQNISRLTETKKSGNHTTLLGFNEPDGKDQANLSVEKALKAWPYLEQTGLRLGSPGAVHADNDWMLEFMTKAKTQGRRVDFITVHWYGGASADSLIRRLHKIHQLYGKPIWITEFAVADWNAKSLAKNKHSKEKIAQFMNQILPKLDQLDFVERYAWFSGSPDHAALGNSALFHKDGSLTKLGKIYAAHGKR